MSHAPSYAALSTNYTVEHIGFLGFGVFFGSKTFSTKEAIVDLHSGALSIPHVDRQTCWQLATLSFTGLRHREGGVLVSY